MATLKISELSVGDWVQNDNGDYSKVEGIWQGYNFSYLVDHLRDGVLGTITPCNLHPIPITAEILLKNGWENLRSGYKCSCGVYDIHIWIKEASVIVTIYERERIVKAVRMQVYSPDMSVHQLQHILRLAGVDKEINL